MPVFLCRWQNGDISLVSAKSKREAIYYLDEFANAEEADLFRLDEFLMDFQLQDDGTLVLSQWGEATQEQVSQKAYPELEKTLLSDELQGLTEDSPQYQAIIRRAVETERNRLSHRRKKVAEPETQIGKQIKEQMDAPTPVIDRIVKNTGREILKKYRPRGPVQ